jgi:hypothetical protein
MKSPTVSVTGRGTTDVLNRTIEAFVSVEVEDNRPGDGEALSDRSLTLVMKGAHLINETTACDMLLRIAEDSRLGAGVFRKAKQSKLSWSWQTGARQERASAMSLFDPSVPVFHRDRGEAGRDPCVERQELRRLAVDRRLRLCVDRPSARGLLADSAR